MRNEVNPGSHHRQPPDDVTEAAEAAQAAAKAALYVEDEAARRSEEELLSDVGVDPADPDLDTAIRELEAGATDDLPFGRPGPPLRRRPALLTGAQVTVGVLAVLALAWAAYVVAEMIVVVIMAIFLATGLDPAVRWLQRQAGVRRGAAVTAVVMTLALALGLFALFAVPALVTQANELREQAGGYARQLRDAQPVLADLDRRVAWVRIVERATSEETIAAVKGRQLMNLAADVVEAIIATLTCITLTVYFLVRFPALKQTAYRLIPRSRRARTSLLLDEILDRIGGYVLGNLATSAVAGVAAFVVLRALGVPHALALAIFVALMDMIPLVGATIGALVTTGVALTVSLPIGIATLVFFFVYQQFENFLLVPHVMRRTVNVSPVTTIVAILIGASLLGVLGALLAVPVAAAIQLIAAHVWVPRQESR